MRRHLTLILVSVLCTSLLADLQTPKLTLRKPNSLAVSPGEGLEFRCEIPGSECKSVNFFLNTASIKSTEKCNEQLSVTASDQGQYTCSYTGVNFTSSKSNTITITVVNLQKPSISMSHSGSDGPDVPRGYDFSISCSTKSLYPNGSFILQFSGSSRTRTQPAVNRSAVFLYPVADFDHQGNYSCIYEVKMPSRTFTSTPSEPLHVTVKESLALYIGVGVTAGLLLILVPVIVCFVMIQKRKKNQAYTKKEEHPQPTEDTNPPEEDEADDEHDYINTETLFHQTDASDGSDHDYLNVEDLGRRRAADNDYEGEGIYQNYAV